MTNNNLDQYVNDYMEYCEEVKGASSEPCGFKEWMTDKVDNSNPLYHNAPEISDILLTMIEDMLDDSSLKIDIEYFKDRYADENERLAELKTHICTEPTTPKST